MTQETIEKVRRFVARELDVPHGDVLPDTRLHSDLGLDGPRAVEFMEHFSMRFHVDIEDLWVHWEEYFSTEGVTLKGVFIFAAAAIALIVLTLLTLPLIAVWIKIVVDLVVLFTLALLFLRGTHTKRDRKEITVGELVTAAREQRLRLR